MCIKAVADCVVSINTGFGTAMAMKSTQDEAGPWCARHHEASRILAHEDHVDAGLAAGFQRPSPGRQGQDNDH